MANEASSSTSFPVDAEDEILMLYGLESGWVEPLSHCDHLTSLSSDLSHIPTPDTHCNSCQRPLNQIFAHFSSNWSWSSTRSPPRIDSWVQFGRRFSFAIHPWLALCNRKFCSQRYTILNHIDVSSLKFERKCRTHLLFN
uniref:Uncharacterized protein n=2 Tax=Nicotiana TaxID=4085 RepID=A0A1S4BS03_TOBAC|nr:PREDICTED: uncharacterized protein LOC104238153 [Nicotiana sylvestris]XP_016491667.1 PREDICTED: uncharacterized protein LOC107811285 [Nicotiana tabacum]